MEAPEASAATSSRPPCGVSSGFDLTEQMTRFLSLDKCLPRCRHLQIINIPRPGNRDDDDGGKDDDDDDGNGNGNGNREGKNGEEDGGDDCNRVGPYPATESDPNPPPPASAWSTIRSGWRS